MNEAPRLLAGRYEVGDLIGRGGMAEVHIGYDTRLGRNVAIKILRADLARDPSFQTRFRREAQAAAGLNHPAIVAVYDTGEDQVRTESGALQAVPFIVMEYVEGHTVRDILKGDVAAPIDEAVEITMGVLAALDYAHHAGLVHRDIKPANVMLTPTGAVKVMDFGIARALADVGQTMTQTQAVVGTAQYLSPEQARGENVDARSDLYSAGCLLFELLTGRPPFVGDSPVSVAYQHVREAAPKPSQFASDVPAALDAVVERSLQKDRNLRYSTAQEFMADLSRAMGHALPPVATPTGSGQAQPWAPQPSSPTAPTAVYQDAGAGAGLAGAGLAGAGLAGAGLGAAAGLPGAAAPGGPAGPVTGATAVMPASAVPGGAAPWGNVLGGPASVPPVAPAPRSTSTTLARDDDYVEDDSRKRLLIQVGIAVAAVLALAALVFALFSLGGGGDKTEPTAATVTVPVLDSMQQDAAEKRLTDLGLVPQIEEEPSADVEEGRVIRTEPGEGEKVPEKSTVKVFISTGAEEAEVPDVKGLPQADAIRQLEEAGLVVETVQREHDPKITADVATRTVPEAKQILKAGDKVTLYVSDGQVDLPDLRNKTSAEAQQLLVAAGLVWNPVTEETLDAAPGTVLEQNPMPGVVPQGSTVTVKVAAAPTSAKVPDVVGKTIAEASNAITGVGLKVSQVNQSSTTVPLGKVISTNPSAGISITLGQTVTVTVSSGPPATATPTPAP